MSKIAIAIHGGAGPDSDHIKKNKEGYETGLRKALEAGFNILANNGSAVDAVEAAVNALEDNPLFNAGRGSAINAKGEVEMCASIMDGEKMKCGAVAIVKNVKNPISLAKAIMKNTDHIYLGGEGALDYAQKINIALEPESYFITENQFEAYDKKRKEKYESNHSIAREQIRERSHGTVGAVALDSDGNLAAATSTGGTEYNKEGRIGDSSMIGVGCFADNNTCAISTTGDGEYLIRGVIAHSVSSQMKYKELSLEEACYEVLFKENKDTDGDMGMVSVDREGNICMTFNSERMHRASMTSPNDITIKIYKEEEEKDENS